MTVQTSMWLISQNGNIDGISPALNEPQACTIGIQMLGGSKTIQKRWIAEFDLMGAVGQPYLGRPLTAQDTIVSVELWGDVSGTTGTTGFGCTIDRITRSDWVYTQATWNIYKTANNWTAAGGDISTPQATFTSPTATGDQLITDQLSGMVTDAIANRSGQCLFRIKATDEGATDHIYGVYSDPDSWPGTNVMRVVIVFDGPGPGGSLMGLSPGII